MTQPVTAIREAITLIDEINKRSTSRAFHGIDQCLHAKLCTIRATLMRATLPPPTRSHHERQDDTRAVVAANPR